MKVLNCPFVYSRAVMQLNQCHKQTAQGLNWRTGRAHSHDLPSPASQGKFPYFHVVFSGMIPFSCFEKSIAIDIIREISFVTIDWSSIGRYQSI